jgi:type IX secretion system PorP/SprF family membrane protein
MYKYLSGYIFGFSLLIFPCSLFAQDIHFSQFFSTPLLISPSNTGNHIGDWRATANFRTQWKAVSQAYNTTSIGIDKQFYWNKEQFSYGAIIVDDRSGGSLKADKIMLSLAYHKKIGKNKFSIGVQPGYVMKSIGNHDTYPDQLNWDMGRFDSGLPNNETKLTYNLSYFDLNAGLGYSRKIKRTEIFASFAAFHLTKPEESFTHSGNKLKIRKVFSGGLTCYANPKIAVQPMLTVMATTKANEFLAGANVWYTLGKSYSIEKAVMAGVFSRIGIENLADAIFITTGLSQKNYFVGLSYDVNISEFRAATSSRGAFEVSFIYTGFRKRLPKIEIPCERY